VLLTTIVDPEEDPLRICHPPDKPELESTEKFGAVPRTTLYLIVRVWVKVPSVAVTFTKKLPGVLSRARRCRLTVGVVGPRVTLFA